MQAQIKLGRLFGIRIGLHYSWLIIAFLIAFSLVEQFATVHRNWSRGVIWGTAIVTAVLFFVCIVLHELGHSVVAQSRGIRVPSIVLFALGGVSQMEKESPDAKTRFRRLRHSAAAHSMARRVAENFGMAEHAARFGEVGFQRRQQLRIPALALQPRHFPS